mmetsp:Transcript_43918/g.86681  ORF Transcript_43918/g.86681 Transcript_43918/m.86681 type:complete len:130 (+) Transcript_43918:580-969(+)
MQIEAAAINLRDPPLQAHPDDWFQPLVQKLPGPLLLRGPGPPQEAARRLPPLPQRGGRGRVQQMKKQKRRGVVGRRSAAVGVRGGDWGKPLGCAGWRAVGGDGVVVFDFEGCWTCAGGEKEGAFHGGIP